MKFLTNYIQIKKSSVLIFCTLLVLLTAVWGGAAWRMISAGSVVRFDNSVGKAFFSHHPRGMDIFFEIFTLFCGMPMVSVLILASLVFFFYKKRNYLLPFAVSAIGSSIFTAVCKLMVHRGRPLLQALTNEDSFSFPSGHATAALGVYGFLVYLLLLEVKSKRMRTIILILSALFILVIGASRLYLGVHYPTDVLAGYIVGLLWFMLGASLLTKKP